MSPRLLLTPPTPHDEGVADLKALAKAGGRAAREAASPGDPQAVAKRNRWAVGAGVVVCGLGFLFVWGLISKIGAYLLMLLFGAGVAAGAWYLIKGKLEAWRAARAAARVVEEAPRETEQDARRRLEAQLAELKRKVR